MIIIYCFKKIQSLFQIVMSLMKIKEYQKAIDAYKEAIKIKPDYHEAYYNMGVAYDKLKEYQEAINTYKEAIKIKPEAEVKNYTPTLCYVDANNVLTQIKAAL
jgi:tetratricopeptide (TPR) repeat protein